MVAAACDAIGGREICVCVIGPGAHPEGGRAHARPTMWLTASFFCNLENLLVYADPRRPHYRFAHFGGVVD